MTTATVSLSSWLLSCIADDEAVARVVLSHGFGSEWCESGDSWQHIRDERGNNILSGATAVLPHIARHDPAHVLAVCAAHRLIVELHSGGHECPDEPYALTDRCATLRALASVYADRAGYREEWR